jgi:hypothetical protein
MNASFFKINFSCKNTQEEKTTIRISEFFSSAPQEVEEKEKPKRNERAKISKNFSPDFLPYLFKNKSQSFKEAMPTLKASF